MSVSNLPLDGSDSSVTDSNPARISLRRRVQWVDTDAAGHYHFSAPLRWIEEAETELFERLGIGNLTAGHVPRVHFEVDYLQRIWFRDLIDVRLTVSQIGRSSLTFEFEVTAAGVSATAGRYVVVYADPNHHQGAPWPSTMRSRFASAGDVSGVSGPIAS